jgi:hypothetical protein
MSRKVKPISRNEYFDKIQNEYRHDKKMDKEFKGRLERALCFMVLFCFPCVLFHKCKKDHCNDD